MSKTADEKKDARLNSGVGAGVFGLCSNAVLFALKTAAGVLSGSITVVADAVNNLSDAGGSALTLAGFRLAARPADREHPFGHARYEYITTLVLSLLVFAVGAVLCYTSVSAVIDPEPLTASAFSYAVLGVAMGVKAVQAAVYLALARRINSGTLRAAALDSLTDILATGAALASTVVADKAGVNIDGWTGIAVSLFVMIMAGKSAAGAVSPPPPFVSQDHERSGFPYEQKQGPQPVSGFVPGPGDHPVLPVYDRAHRQRVPHVAV